MIKKIEKIKKIIPGGTIICLGRRADDFAYLSLTDKEKEYVKEEFRNDEKVVFINKYDHFLIALNIEKAKDSNTRQEKIRKTGNNLFKVLEKRDIEIVIIAAKDSLSNEVKAICEGLVLSSYEFTKYKKGPDKSRKTIEKVQIFCNGLNSKEIAEIQNIIQAVFYTRDLVNEPPNNLTATDLSNSIEKLGKKAGFEVQVLNKKQIESLKMGGLLAVNQGSIDPPTLTILEWKPKYAVNEKPYLFVGKGVVYDTGGLSIKSTSNSMDLMKSDMAGAASIAGIFFAIAKNKIPVHIVGLIPATDNRTDARAFVPGDIITMHNGLQVEITNTDAEGRLVLADGISYGNKFNPKLVISVATLTGSARVSLGLHGIVAMGNADKKYMKILKECGNKVYERLVEFPFWEEYKDMLKSDIADLKNLGGKGGGAISAGKFLEHFTDLPFIHLDMAGPAFLTTSSSYRGKGGTGVGVRLLYSFIKELSQKG